ncbi:MAG: DUF3102 domain-containing protein [Nanoarchaeota archaeon]
MTQILIKKSKEESIKEVKQLQKQGVKVFWRIGEELANIKEQCKHGEFEEIVNANFDFTIRNAQRLMQIYRTFKSDEVSQFKISQILELSKLDSEEERKEFIEEIEDKIPPLKELKEKIKILKLKKDRKEEGEKQFIDLEFMIKKLKGDLDIITQNIRTVNLVIEGIHISKKELFEKYERRYIIYKEVELVNHAIDNILLIKI